jgi:hypothetical protein
MCFLVLQILLYLRIPTYSATPRVQLKHIISLTLCIVALSMPDFAADSKERTAVVPMAIMRPPLALVWLILSTLS